MSCWKLARSAGVTGGTGPPRWISISVAATAVGPGPPTYASPPDAGPMKYPPGIWNAMCAAACHTRGTVCAPVGYGSPSTVEPGASHRPAAAKNGGTGACVIAGYG